MLYIDFALTVDILSQQRALKIAPIVPIKEYSVFSKTSSPFSSFLKLSRQQKRLISLTLFKTLKPIFPGI